MKMPVRYGSESNGKYQFGFNGMRMDDEMYSQEGNSYDFGARQYDSRIGRWQSPDAYEWAFSGSSTYSYSLNNPITFVDKNGDFPMPKAIVNTWLVCVIKGAAVGGISEFAFSLMDRMIFEGENFTSAIQNVDKSDIAIEAGKGAILGCNPFGSYAAVRIQKLFTGRYRKLSMYFIQQGMEVVEDALTEISKDYLNGEEVDLSETIQGIVGEKIYNEIITAKAPSFKKLRKKSKKIRKLIDKSKDAAKKSRDFKKKFEKTKNKKFKKLMKKYSKKAKKYEQKAVKKTFKEYKKLGNFGDELKDEMMNRAETRVKEKLVEGTVTFGTLESNTVIDDSSQ